MNKERPAGKNTALLLSLVLIAATLLFYSGSFKNDFVWDDRSLILDCPYLYSLSHWQKLFVHNVGYSGGARNNFYRPLYSLLNAVNYRMGGGTPFFFHLTNTLLHASTAALVFILIYLISKERLVAFATALLFALHPVQTQAVTYIAGRADPLYLLFALAAFIFFIIYLQRNKNISIYLLSIAAFLLSLLAKESAVITPFFILLYIYTIPEDTKVDRTKKIRYLIPHFCILGGYLLLRASVSDFSKTAYSALALQTPPLHIRTLTACKAIFLYFRFLIVPTRFHMETHLANSKSLMEDETFFAVLGVVALIFLIRYLRRRNKFLFFGAAWFFLGLLPVLNVIFPVNAAIAVHWLYLPSIGFFFTVSFLLWNMLDKAKRPHLFILPVLIIGLALGVLTYQKNREWKDEETLYTSILPYSQTPRVYVNLGNIFARKGEFDKAIPLYKKALEIAPRQTEVYVNLGYIYNNRREYKKAEETLKKAISATPRSINAHYNLAITYINTGRYEEALYEIEETLNLNPNHLSALNAKGEMCKRLGLKDEARKALERSLSINPAQPDVKRLLENL